jgi:hypothetical protein
MGMEIGEVAPCGGKGRCQLGNALEMGVSEGSKKVDIERVEVEVGSKHGGDGSRGKADNLHMGVAKDSGHDRMSNLRHEGLVTQLHAETRLLKVPCSSTLPLSIFG